MAWLCWGLMFPGKWMCCCCWSQPDSGQHNNSPDTSKAKQEQARMTVWKARLSTAGWQGQTSPWRNLRNTPVPEGHPTWQRLRSHHPFQGTQQGLERIWIDHNFLLPAVEVASTAQCLFPAQSILELWASRNWCWAVGTQALGSCFSHSICQLDIPLSIIREK